MTIIIQHLENFFYVKLTPTIKLCWYSDVSRVHLKRLITIYFYERDSSRTPKLDRRRRRGGLKALRTLEARKFLEYSLIRISNSARPENRRVYVNTLVHTHTHTLLIYLWLHRVQREKKMARKLVIWFLAQVTYTRAESGEQWLSKTRVHVWPIGAIGGDATTFFGNASFYQKSRV